MCPPVSNKTAMSDMDVRVDADRIRPKSSGDGSRRITLRPNPLVLVTWANEPLMTFLLQREELQNLRGKIVKGTFPVLKAPVPWQDVKLTMLARGVLL